MEHETTHKQNVARYFAHSADYWEDVYEYDENRAQIFENYSKNRRKSLVLSCLDAYAGQRSLTVLDIGCGPGLFMEESLRRGHTVTGIDISSEMLSKATRRLEKFGKGNFTCLQGDQENLPPGNETVDVVLSLGVLPYLRDDGKGVEEINRVLKKGGILICILPNLIKLSALLDPYYYLVRIWRYLWYRLHMNDASSEMRVDPASFNDNRYFNVRRYTRNQALVLLRVFGMVTDDHITPIEYGPLTFWKKEILSDSTSITLSRYCEIRSERFVWLKNFCNEWVICVSKPS